MALQKGHSLWGEYVTSLLELGLHTGKVTPCSYNMKGIKLNNLLAKKGMDAGDHPPITPMRKAEQGELSGDDWRLYDYVTRHFIATLSPNCKYSKLKVIINFYG